MNLHSKERLAILLAIISQAGAADLAIVNGDFEADADNAAPPTGWVDLTPNSFWSGVPGETGNPSGNDAASAPGGLGNFFLTTARQSAGVGSQPIEGSLVQTVDLTAFATGIDAGGQTAEVAFIYSSNDSRDSGSFSLHYFPNADGSGAELGTGQSVALNAGSGFTFSGWQEMNVGGAIPAGTRSVILRIDTTRTGGSETNLWIDNINGTISADGTTDPQGDSDGDGLPDAFEDAIIAFSTTDAVDGYEDIAGPNDAPATTDFDGDGLSDADEFVHLADPTDSDSDDDGLEDGPEVAGTDNDHAAHGYGPTRPNAPDTDKDGYGDAVEIAAGTNPNALTDLPASNLANPRSLPGVSGELEAGGFSILTDGVAASLVYDATDAVVVAKAVNLFADDIEAVGGVRPVVTASADGLGARAVLVGTVGQSSLIDGLVAAGKLDITGIRGSWESYRLARVENPLPGLSEALVIAGSDRRGTAYGLGAISEAMGVSPWTWWADVPPSRRTGIHLSGLPLDSAPPTVRFRGIFINDEDWGLQEWAEKNYESGADEVKDLGPKSYARIFELLLRLRCNYCWPGMHPSTRAFNHYPDNKQIADDYAIVMGSSHAEPMLRNNVFEWYNDTDPVTGQTYDNGSWNYSSNKEGIYRYWDERAKANGAFESVFTVGKRGIHDSGMVEGSGNTEKAAWLNTIFTDQREILSNRVNPDPAEVAQIFVPYKEVLAIYETGLVNVPDDVTLVWPDDNHGYIRRLSDASEQQRGGGGGVYYHLSYWGAPADFLWLSTIPPSLIWEEMSKAHENQCGRLWVFNVGDIKPAEISMEFSLRLAWNVHSYGPDCQEIWLKEWAAREFGVESAGAIASLMNDYYRLNHRRKPEHMDVSDSDPASSSTADGSGHFLFSQVHEGDEVEARLREFALLRQRADAIFDKVPAGKRDAFYQLVVYPVRGSEAMARKFLHTARAHRAVSQGRKTVGEHSAAASAAYTEIGDETTYYNTGISSGKWNEMMDWRPRGLGVFNLPNQPADPGVSGRGLGVAVEGRLEPVFTRPTSGSGPIELDAVNDAATIVAPIQAANLDGLACLWTPGSGGAANAGAGGRADYSFTIAEAGNYAISFLVRTPNANDDSWHLELDGAAPVVWNNLGTSNPSGWRWRTWDTVSLTAGNHSLKVHEREDGAAFAMIRIATPTGSLGEDQRFMTYRLPEFNSVTRRSHFIDLINTEASPLTWSATTDDAWVRLSNSSGSLATEERLHATIDWDQLPAGESLSSTIHLHQGADTIAIPVAVWNPANPPTDGFIEENGAVVMEAEHATATRAGSVASWLKVPNLGRGDGAMIVQPTNAPSLTTPTEILAGAPSLEYTVHLRTAGDHQVEAVFLPALSLNTERGRRYAVAVDDGEPTIVSLSSESGSGSIWSRSVLRSSISGTSTHPMTAGTHTLKVWMVDPGLVLDRIEIHTAPAPYTHEGLRETAVASADTLVVEEGETVTLDANARYRRIVNHGTLEIRSAAIAVEEDVINFGTLRVTGTASFSPGGNLANFGILDTMAWENANEFSNKSDFGAGLDQSHFEIDDHWLADGTFHIRVPGYTGHRYTLEMNPTLTALDWTPAGPPRDGTGLPDSPVPITFNWPINEDRQFFRVMLDGVE